MSCWKYSSSSPNKSPRHRTTLNGPAFAFKIVSLLIASFNLPFAEPRTRTRTEVDDMNGRRSAKLTKKGNGDQRPITTRPPSQIKPASVIFRRSKCAHTRGSLLIHRHGRQES